MGRPLTASETAASALLPAGMMDVLPPHAAFEAATIERLLGRFAGFGYERVKPPLIEFEDTLLAGSGAALARQTFRLMDPVSQRMLALRPDLTLQIARIAASRMAHRPRPLRLAYGGQVVRVRGSQLRPQRQFGVVGAELIGADAAEADAEIIVMATGALAGIGLEDITVDLGLPSLVPSLLADRVLPEATRARLHAALERKDIASVGALAPALGAETARRLCRLLTATGPAAEALSMLADEGLPREALAALAMLERVAGLLGEAAPQLTLTVDPVERRGFEYHCGVTFALFARGVSGDLGRGGRYLTGNDEDATGVTLFLDTILPSLPLPPPAGRVFLPFGTDREVGERLRGEGWITVAGLDGAEPPIPAARRLMCSHLLADGQVRTLD